MYDEGVLMRALLSFFTNIPCGWAPIEKAADQVYLLPVLSVVYASIAFLLFHVPFAAPVLLAFSPYLFYGINHLDGFGDFFDGLYGGKRAMKDPCMGVASFGAMSFLILASYLFATTVGTGVECFHRYLMADLAARCSLFASMTFRPAHEGLGSAFHSRFTAGRFVGGAGLSLGIGFAASATFGSWLALAVIPAGLAAGLAMGLVATRRFGGTSGDVMGAANEMGRLVAYMLLGALP